MRMVKVEEEMEQIEEEMEQIRFAERAARYFALHPASWNCNAPRWIPESVVTKYRAKMPNEVKA